MKTKITIFIIGFLLLLVFSKNVHAQGNAFDITTGSWATTPAGFVIANNYTVEAWIQPANFSGDKTFVSTRNSGEFTFDIKIRNGGNQIQIDFGNAAGAWFSNQAFNFTFTANRWYHVACSISTTTFTIYVNGTVVGTSNYCGGCAPVLFTGGNLLCVGGYQPGNELFTGKIDEVRIWRAARTQAEIRSTMYNTLVGNEANLSMYYQMNDNLTDLATTDGQQNLTPGAGFSYTESYAMVVPVPTAATSITVTSFTANWTAPTIGTVEKYYLQVDDNSDFSSPLAGYNSLDCGTNLSQSVTGLTSGVTYYYRVRAYKASVGDVGLYHYSSPISVTVPYFTPFGNALDFDGSNDYVNIGSWATPANLTVEAWVYPTNTTGFRTISSQYNGWPATTAYILRLDNGTPTLYLSNGGSTVVLSSGQTLNVNQWYHISATYDGTTAKIYIDGVLKSSTGSLIGIYQSAGIEQRIGNSVSAGEHFLGKIDEFRMWNIARSQADIQADRFSYITSAHAQWSNLKAYYRFDQGNAGSNNSTLINEVVDFSGNCNKGTLTNFGLTGATSNWVYPGNAEAPIVSTLATTLPIGTTANLYGNITSIGETTVETRGFQISTSACMTSPTTVSETGTYTAGTYSLNVTGLTNGTTYYYRAYATNSLGTTYGETGSFVLTPFYPLGNALNFNGSDDHVDCGVNASTNITSSMTVELWINPSANLGGSWNRIVHRNYGNGYYLGGIAGNTNALIVILGGDFGVVQTPSNTVTVGEWQHIGFVFDDAANTVKIYRNGIVVAQNLNWTGTIPGGANTLTMSAAGSEDFPGSMDEVRIWNTARSQTDIISDMCSYITSSHSQWANLKAYFRFDQGTAGGDNTTLVNEVVDYSGNCNNGSIATLNRTGATSNWIHPGNPEAPILTTNAATSVYSTTTLNGNIISTGETSVTTRGFQYSTSSCLAAPTTVSETGTYSTGTYSLSATGLSIGTTYYYRAYATNSKGTTYGEIQSFVPAAFTTPLGNALNFDGASAPADFVRVMDPFETYTTTLTVEAWINFTGSTNPCWMGQSSPDVDNMGTNVWLWHNNGANAFTFYVNDAGTGGWKSANGSATTGWHHVATVADATSLRVYIDGVQVSAGTGIIGPIRNNAASVIDFGKDPRFPTGAGRNTTGTYDEIRVWSTARTVTEIQQNMYKYLAGNETGLVEYHRFDQGIAGGDNTANNQVVDNSGNCRTGILMTLARTGATSNWVHPGNPEAPILTTATATPVYGNSATMNGNIFSIGETSVTTRGFQVSTSNCMTSPLVFSETGTFAAGPYSLTASGLIPLTTYFYRSYATNSKGTSYGEIQQFTTTAFTTLGNALHFDGTDYISIPDNGTLDLQTTFTIEAWIYPTDAANNTIIDKGDYNFLFQTHSNSNTGLGFYNNTMGWKYSSGTVPINVWSHVAVTFNIGSDEIKFYLNGTLLSTHNGLSNQTLDNSEINIGRQQPTSCQCNLFNGYLDELRVWNTARTQAEIQTNMYSYVTSMTGLATYYRFDQGNAGADNTALPATAIDYSGNCNNGDISNFTRNGATSNWVHPGNAEAPILTTTAASSISYNTATFNGNIFSLGESALTVRGFQYSTSACFTTYSTVTEAVSATGVYNLSATGLTDLTTYYVRAFATNSNGATYGESQSFTTLIYPNPGTCLTFDGIDDYVICGNAASLQIGTGTVEAWFNTSAPGASYRAIVVKAYAYGIFLTDNKLLVYDWTFGPKFSGTVNYNDGLWHHVAMSFQSGVVNGTNIYVDGILVGTFTLTMANQSYSLTIGNNDNQAQQFGGKIEEVRIWNDVRTQDELISYMNRTIPNPAGEANLVSYYKLDNGSGTTVTDLKGTNHGTFVSVPVWTNSDAFNIWTGATNSTWATASNWSDADGAPGTANAGNNVYIGTTNTPSILANTTLSTVVVQSGATFTVSAANLLTVNSNFFNFGTTNIAASTVADPGKLTVNGSLYLGTGANLNLLTPANDKPSGSLITNGSILGTGTINIDRYFTVSDSWQQVGVPMTNQSTALFTENLTSGYYNANLYTYEEGFNFTTNPTTANYASWNAQSGYWDFAQPLGDGNGVSMTPGTGYFYYSENNPTVTFTSAATNLVSVNTDIPVTYTDNDHSGFGNYYDGWNLVANPFASAIDWTSFSKPANMDATAYLWNGVTKNYQYISETPLWGVGQTNNGVSSNYIPAMQGFTVHLSNQGAGNLAQTLTIPRSARAHNAQALLKGATTTSDFEHFKLTVQANGLSDELQIGYFDDATTGFDAQYDAFKRFPGNTIPMLYALDNNALPLALHALPTSAKGERIQLGLQSQTSGNHTISLSENEVGSSVILRDLLLNTETNLAQTDYTFTFTAGDNRNRFELFTNSENSNLTTVKENAFSVFPNPTTGIVILNVKNSTLNYVEICDISGKILLNVKVENKNSEADIDLSTFDNGLYFINIHTSEGTFVSKVLKQ